MTAIHPLTPPPEMIARWEKDWHHAKVKHVQLEDHIATQAARWGADQELEACCEWMANRYGDESHAIGLLRAARRPNPPSLKQQALKELKDWTDEKHGPGGEVHLCEGLSVAIIRRALEQLDD
jgi:hypothetical protein